MTIKDFTKIYNVNPLYLIFRNVNRYFEEINKNKYLTLVTTNESKEKIKKYEELWIKIGGVIMSITKTSDDYDEKYMKIKILYKTSIGPNHFVLGSITWMDLLGFLMVKLND